MQRIALSLLIAGLVIAPVAVAADGPQLTLYHSTDDNLFHAGHGALDSGYAVIHEQREVGYAKGVQDITLGNLPDYLDPEAVVLRFHTDTVRVLSQRLLLAQGSNGSLIGQIGKQVSVIGANGHELVRGQLMRVGRDGSLVIGGDVFGPTVVQHYSAVKLIGGSTGGGSRLELHIDADDAGHRQASLTYPTSGLGWRAAYTATLAPGESCHMTLDAEASIANRSGRDWNNASVKLVAGQPNIAQQRIGGPLPMNAMASAAKAMPRQDTLDAYRSFTLPSSVDLPDNSVSITPLYHPHHLDCQRTWTFETGHAWIPPKPAISPAQNAQIQSGSIASRLRFHAFDTLPAGTMRVLTTDKDGQVEFLGSGPVPDTAKGGDVNLELGTAFDLHAMRERTAFNLDSTDHHLDEAFRVTVSNTGEASRTVNVIEHPDRWTQWTLASSSIKPQTQTTDTLVFQVNVPAHGKATLDYAIHYQWSATDE